jgi:hypothetical protein
VIGVVVCVCGAWEGSVGLAMEVEPDLSRHIQLFPTGKLFFDWVYWRE